MPGDEDNRELQSLGVVHREQRHLSSAVDAVGIGNQRRMIQEIRQCFAALGRIGRRIDQFDKVARARLGFRVRVLLEHPLIARYDRGRAGSADRPDAYRASAFSSSIIVLKH